MRPRRFEGAPEQGLVDGVADLKTRAAASMGIHVPRVALIDPARESSMRYIRICMGGESGEPGMTLYEVDEGGWVHRQVQVHAEGTRFSPEDILMCHPVVTDSMARHPSADEIQAEEFELLWAEVVDERAFMCRIPDASMPWAGRASFAGRSFEFAWSPGEMLGEGWTQIPGFVRLWVRGDAKTARAACACVFAPRELEWYSVAAAA